MSKTLLGNNKAPVLFNTGHVSYVDDEEIDLEGEILEEEIIYAYRAICPKKSESTKVNISFYYYAPTSEWYWDYDYCSPYTPLIPVVFTADTNWKLKECLNKSLHEVSTNGCSNGWISMDVTLKRQLSEGERIVFGVYSDLHGYVASEYVNPKTTYCYFYWTRAKRNNYSSQTAYLSSSEFIKQEQDIFSDYEICLYLQYENQPDGISYSRSLTANAEINAIFPQRKLCAKRNSTNVFYLKSISQRFAQYRIYRTEKLSFTDFARKLLHIIRTCELGIKTYDSTNRKSDYKKRIVSIASNFESVTRSGDNFRSFEDKSNITALPFASRIFYRTVKTVMSFWDWLRGKIRETNFVVSLFTPVVLEIKLDGKNMQKIYKGKSKLRILLDCRCDLTGYEKVNLAARKPDDTLVTFPAVVKDAENGIIFYDTQSESDIDQVGWWTFWPEFVFDDDRTSCGSAYRTFVYEVGT